MFAIDSLKYVKDDWYNSSSKIIFVEKNLNKTEFGL